jgi:hypothetical protein
METLILDIDELMQKLEDMSASGYNAVKIQVNRDEMYNECQYVEVSALDTSSGDSVEYGFIQPYPEDEYYD